MTRQILSDRQEGMLIGLRAAEKIARTDLRVEVAKDCGYEPGWQKGRWAVANEIATVIDKLFTDGVSEDK